MGRSRWGEEVSGGSLDPPRPSTIVSGLNSVSLLGVDAPLRLYDAI
jgi:hypothetical protein